MTFRSEAANRLRRANNLRTALRRATSRTAHPLDGTAFAGLKQLLPDGPANVAVLAGPDFRDLGPVLDALAGSKVHVFSQRALPEWRLVVRGIKHVKTKHIGLAAWHLKRYGPFDAIINCAQPGKDGPFYVWRRLFLHLRAGGVYLCDRSLTSDKEWQKLINGLRKLAPMADVDEDSRVPPAEMSAAVDGVFVDRRAIAITKRNDHWLKLRNEEADRFLVTRDVPLSSRIIATVPQHQFCSRASLHLHPSTTEPKDFPSSFSYPQLYLHEYIGDVTLASHSLLFTDRTILPESFRWQQVPVLNNTKTIESSTAVRGGEVPSWNYDFARIPEDLQAERVLDGEYFHLDCPYPGHFGHLMTEVISRLWGWQQAKQENPALKAILRVYRGDRTPRLEKTIFTAYGIVPDDIVWTGEPVRLRSIVGATPMWQNASPHYVHPDILDVWHRLGRGLITDDTDLPEKIFVSRREEMRRACRNRTEVETYFAEHGYEIIYPEMLDLAHQATIFANARVIAGFGGSAMFNLLFARHLEKTIVLAHEAYTARNEYLYASVLGGEIHYVWSEPDVHHPGDRISLAAFQSSWTFDWDRNRDVLDKIVD